MQNNANDAIDKEVQSINDNAPENSVQHKEMTNDDTKPGKKTTSESEHGNCKGTQGGNTITKFIDIARDQIVANRSFKEKMLEMINEDNVLRKEESSRESKKAKIELFLSLAAAARSAGDHENDSASRSTAAKLAESL